MEAAGTQSQRKEEEDGRRWNLGIYQFIRNRNAATAYFSEDGEGD